MSTNSGEGLKIARLMMVLSSMAPLFMLWAIRGMPQVVDLWWAVICGSLIIIPNVILFLRIWLAKKSGDEKIITVGKAEDHRDHLLVYLFSMLLPFYTANLSETRELIATICAFLFIVFLFWHLNLHYMNIVFALFGYRVFTIQPLEIEDGGIGGKESYAVLTKRTHLNEKKQITCLRLSNTVYFEKRGV